MRPGQGQGHRIGMILLASAGLGACELSEVAIPSSDPIVIVQAIMRPDLIQQWVLVEKSLTGAEERQSTPGDIPPSPPQLPITGATVTVENLSFPADPCGSPVLFTPRNLFGSVDGVYWSPRNCPAMRPGDTLRLRVETPDGEVVTGETIVAAVDGMFLKLNEDSIPLPATQIGFNRDTDTLKATVVAVSGRATQVDVRWHNRLNQTRRVTSVFVDTTSLTLPGDLQDFFRGGTGDPIFRGGRLYTLAVAFGDGNYFDFIRSANGEVSGTGFINHLVGGVGVFASLVAMTTDVRVVAEADDPREGMFNVTGVIRGDTVNLSWEPYLLDSVGDSTDFSAFIGGRWLTAGTLDVSAHGFFIGNRMHAEFEHQAIDSMQVPPEPGAIIKWTVEGTFSPNSNWSLDVIDQLGRPFGTLSMGR